MEIRSTTASTSKAPFPARKRSIMARMALSEIDAARCWPKQLLVRCLGLKEKLATDVSVEKEARHNIAARRFYFSEQCASGRGKVLLHTIKAAHWPEVSTQTVARSCSSCLMYHRTFDPFSRHSFLHYRRRSVMSCSFFHQPLLKPHTPDLLCSIPSCRQFWRAEDVYIISCCHQPAQEPSPVLRTQCGRFPSCASLRENIIWLRENAPA